MQVPTAAPAPADRSAPGAPPPSAPTRPAAGQPAAGVSDAQGQPDLVFYDPVGRAAPRWRLRLAGALGVLLVAGGPAVALSDPKRRSSVMHGARRFVRRLRPNSAPRPAEATVEIASVPDRASVVLDDEELGHTPVALPLPAGRYQIAIRRSGYVDAAVRVELTANAHARVVAHLWSATPRVARVRPALPGATIAGASFLADGALAVALLLPGGARQLWLADPSRPPLRLDGGALPENCPAAVLSPDGAQIAWVVPGSRAAGMGRPAGARPDEVWIGPAATAATTATTTTAATARGMPVSPTAIYAGAPSERLLDLTWAPDGRALVLVTQRATSATVQFDSSRRTRLLWLPVDGGATRGAEDLAELPSDVVGETWSWSPDGQWVAFTARPTTSTATTTTSSHSSSLCLLLTPEGPPDGGAGMGPRLRYVADVPRGAGPLAVPPVAWSHDGAQLAYAESPTPAAQGGLWPIGTKTETPLAIARFEARTGDLMPSGAARLTGTAPVWRADGTLGVLARLKNKGPLHVRIVDLANTTDAATGAIASVPLAALPAVTPAACAVRWDPRHAQAFLAIRESQLSGTPQVSCWLVRFGGDHANAEAGQ